MTILQMLALIFALSVLFVIRERRRQMFTRSRDAAELKAAARREIHLVERSGRLT
jgi:hypothetical protein